MMSSARPVRIAGPERHPLELDAVRIQKVHRVVIVVIFGGRVDDVDVVRFEEYLQFVHVVAAAQLEGIMMQADIVLVASSRSCRRFGGHYPEGRPAVPPSGHVAEAADRLESQESKEAIVELSRSV